MGTRRLPHSRSNRHGRSILAGFTRWILHHRLLVAAVWIVLAVVGFAFTQQAVNALSFEFSLPGQEGYETNVQIQRLYSDNPANPPFVAVVRLPPGSSVHSPSTRNQLGRVFARLGSSLPGARAVSYVDTGNPVFVSRDGRTTYGLIYAPEALSFAGPAQTESSLRRALRGATVDGQPVHLTGIDALAAGGNSGGGPSVLGEAMIGGALALLVLIFVFRSVMAIIPLLMAAFTIPVTFLVIWGLTAITNISFIVEFLVALIGLGVAIDYSLIIVLRWREERRTGADDETAVVRAIETAGTAVLFSGTTVAIGLLALLVLPVPFLRSVGYGGALIPLITVLAALTLLPVTLFTIGPRVDWPRPSLAPTGRFWTAWASLVIRARWLAAGVGLVILLLLVIAGTHIVLGQTGADALSSSGDAHTGLVLLKQSGIGEGPLSPIELLATPAGAQRLAAREAAVAGVSGAVSPENGAWQRGGTAIVEVIPSVDSNTPAGHQVLDRVRAVAHAANPPAKVGGQSAQNVDFIKAVYGNFPLMITLIALITLVLLARAFRSLLLPLKAVALNVLSVGAAWGIMVLIWQDGYGSKAIWGIPATGAITSWVPLMVFAFLFGLSMDYEVFILARVREEYDGHGNTNASVRTGIGRTGRLVTSAALILFFAFIALASGPETDIKVIGTGLAAGILVDATVVRMLLVPALVSLFGRWNWWLPAGPARILRVAPSRLEAPAE